MQELEGSILEYWAKTTSTGEPGISVIDHLRNVGHVACLLSMQNQRILDLLKLDRGSIAFLAASHDVGKISQGFQQKCRVWIERNGLAEKARKECWKVRESNHSKISQFSLHNFLLEHEISANSAGLISAVIGAHHGRLHKVTERGLHPCPGMMKDQWEILRQSTLKNLEVLFGTLNIRDLNQNDAALWWLAGLISVSDWIGSDERFFPADKSVEDTELSARNALEQIGFTPSMVKNGLSFKDLFEFEKPNDMQKATVEFIKSPGMYVIEAPMGLGKTEAALWSAYRLMSTGKASGIYFALPTQATSNRIHIRMSEIIKRMTSGNEHTRLIHGNSWLVENIDIPKMQLNTSEKNFRSSDIVRDWFASRKRSLLAPFGVGTVDQALLGIIAARHFFVRRFALSGKVVIIDEVHSYDMYTKTLIDILCCELIKLGCTVIILSATLTWKSCKKLFDSYTFPENKEYPLLTGRSFEKDTVCQKSVAVKGIEKKVNVQFKNLDDTLLLVTKVARGNGSVIWICDTVASSQDSYRRIKKVINDEKIDVGLIHSRFPFFRREELENIWMERLGKGERQGGCILVSTQVVEQSVDLDADLMVSELAPTDMLLQRLGRLWRHHRTNRPMKEPILIIINEKDTIDNLRHASSEQIKDAFGEKAFVYSPYILWRSWEVFYNRQEIEIPGDIRELLDRTYEERDEDNENLINLENDWSGNEYAKRQKAEWESNPLGRILLDDVEGAYTRLNEYPTVSLVLAKKINKNDIVLLTKNKIEMSSLKKSTFDLKASRLLNVNVVRVPRSALIIKGQLPQHKLLNKYVIGESCWAVVDEQGMVTVLDLDNTQKKLYYKNETGIEIT